MNCIETQFNSQAAFLLGTVLMQSSKINTFLCDCCEGMVNVIPPSKIFYPPCSTLRVRLIILFLSYHQRTPLHSAAKAGHQNIVEYLVGERNADIDVKDGFGVSI